MAEETLFTFLNQIQNKQRTAPYDRKIASAWMISQWLSHDKELIDKVNAINQFQFLLPDEVIYNYYMDVIPAGKRFIKFIKKRKDDDKLKNRIEKLQEQYPEMSVRECKMIISYLMNRKK
jgi:hypothetical protein